ncbi:hypothetical protein KH5H1_27990 [Corallococcus caeni]|nr:hypothetical protein KH5H1_27990 [Corallococcus sp. KH5-1]
MGRLQSMAVSGFQSAAKAMRESPSHVLAVALSSGALLISMKREPSPGGGATREVRPEGGRRGALADTPAPIAPGSGSKFTWRASRGRNVIVSHRFTLATVPMASLAGGAQ